MKFHCNAFSPSVKGSQPTEPYIVLKLIQYIGQADSDAFSSGIKGYVYVKLLVIFML